MTDDADLIEWAAVLLETAIPALGDLGHEVPQPPATLAGPTHGVDRLHELARRLRAEDATRYLQEIRRG